MGRLPNHASPPLLYFHMLLPKIVLLLYSDFCIDTYFPDKSHPFWYVTVYLHALNQLYYSITSSCSVFHWYITAPLCKFRIYLHLLFSCEVFLFWAVFVFADILAIWVVFTQTSRWFSQYPYPRPISMWIYHHYDKYWWITSLANYTGVTRLLCFSSITCPLNIINIISQLFFDISSRTSPNQ